MCTNCDRPHCYVVKSNTYAQMEARFAISSQHGISAPPKNWKAVQAGGGCLSSPGNGHESAELCPQRRVHSQHALAAKYWTALGKLGAEPQRRVRRSSSLEGEHQHGRKA